MFTTYSGPGLLPPDTSATELLHSVLNVSLTSVLLWRPVPGDDGEVADFALEYVNPTAQRLLHLTARPGGTLRSHFPNAWPTGVFAFYQRVFASGEPDHMAVAYQADGLDGYYHIAALRSGPLLVVSYTNTADQDRTSVVEALRESRASEGVALADVLRQRQRLVGLFEQTPALIARLTGPDHVFELANAAFRAAFGERPLVGLTFREALPELAGHSVLSWLDQVYQTGTSHYDNAVLVPAAADSAASPARYFNLACQATRDAQGQLSGVFLFAYDVTEQVRASQQLQELNDDLETQVADRTRAALAIQAAGLAAAHRQVQEREAFYQVFEQTPALIALLREPNHRIEYHNPAFQQLFPGRNLLGRTIGEIAPELAELGLVDQLDGVFAAGQPRVSDELAFAVAGPDGAPATRYFTFTCQAYREGGRTAGVTLFGTDVTEQVRARRQRQAQQLELEQLFMEAPAPIVILDGPDLVFQLVNPAYQQVFPGRELLHRPLLEALPELQDTPIPGLIRAVYASGEPYEAQEMPLMMARRPGEPLEEIFWTFVYQARRNEAGQVDGVRVFAHDVTTSVLARRRVSSSEQQARTLAHDLLTTNEQLTRANADLDAFAYTASHDLNAPLTNLQGLLAALLEELPPEVPQLEHVQPLLHLMQESLNRFQGTLAQLTDVIREQADQQQAPEPVALADLIEGICLDLQPLIDATGARITIDAAGCPSLWFAPRNLRSIVFNLLSNALKYRDPARPPVVHIHCDATEDEATLVVQDNGLGLTEHQQKRLFGLFQRLHTHVEGSGLGLYTIKKIVGNAGGTIRVQSQPGVGSTFTVSLPRHRPPVPH